MQLPNHLSDDFQRVEDKDIDDISVGSMLYFAPDGEIHYISDSSPMSFELHTEDRNEYWKMRRSELEDSLYTDHFPVKLTGYGPE